MAYRDKHRLQPCEPKPRPAEARKTRPAAFGTKTTTCADREAEYAKTKRTHQTQSAEWQARRKPKQRTSVPGSCGPRNTESRKTAEREKPTANNATQRLAETAERKKPTANNASQRIAKPKDEKTGKKNARKTKQLSLINPPAPLRRQRTAESTGRADETVSPKTARRVKQTCLNLRRREDVPARNRGPCHSGP